MTAHAKFSPSGAARWLRCPGSIALEEGIESKSSAYAEEGTRLHKLAADTLDRIVVEDLSPANVDMPSEIRDYVKAVWDAAEGGALMVEQKVVFGPSIGLSEEEGFGTVDANVIVGDRIEIHDLKTGRGVRVDAEENEQLMLYALGALHTFAPLGPFEKVKLVIHQVSLYHVSTWEITVDELEFWSLAVKRTIASIKAGNAPFEPGEKQCRFCKAKATCPALAEHVQETIGAEFPDLGEMDDPKAMGNNRLAVALDNVDLIEAWTKAVRERAYEELSKGRPVPGYKLVAGKRGSRQWADEEAARTALKSMRLKVEEMHEMNLISPTTAEKLHKAGTLGERQWSRLQGLITQADGKPHVAPESDKRPALTPSVEDFPLLENPN